MKHLELTIPGRPVPWARARVSKAGGMFTAEKQREHRKAVAFELKAEAGASEMGKFSGPAYLQVLFVYGEEPGTWLALTEMIGMENHEPIMPLEIGDAFHSGRPDIDNLVKQIMEAIEDSGILSGEDGQISMVIAAKVKR